MPAGIFFGAVVRSIRGLDTEKKMESYTNLR
jgi:hypothetical protein